MEQSDSNSKYVHVDCRRVTILYKLGTTEIDTFRYFALLLLVQAFIFFHLF